MYAERKRSEGAENHRDRSGGAEIARPDIARPDNAAPYCETCFGVRVDAHYKFMFAAGTNYYMSCSSN